MDTIGAGCDIIMKICIAGDTGVGKTSLLARYCEGGFSFNTIATVGVDFKFKKVVDDKHNIIKLQLWDLAGSTTFRTVVKSYFRSSHVIVFMFDIISETSYRNIAQWLQAAEWSNDGMVLGCLVGTKLDLEKDRVVQAEDAQQYAAEHNMTYYEVSSRSGKGIELLFKDIVRRMEALDAKLQQDGKDSILWIPKDTSHIVSLNEAQQLSRKGCC